MCNEIKLICEKINSFRLRCPCKRCLYISHVKLNWTWERFTFLVFRPGFLILMMNLISYIFFSNVKSANVVLTMNLISYIFFSNVRSAGKLVLSYVKPLVMSINLGLENPG